MSLSISPSDRQPPVNRPAEVPARSPSTPAKPGSPTSDAPAPATDAQDTQRELREAVDRLNELARKQGRDLSFSMDEKVNRTVITVKNAQTGEVVRQIPDETLLKVARSIEDFKGLLHNEWI